MPKNSCDSFRNKMKNKLFLYKSYMYNHLTVRKQISSGSFKNVIYKLFVNKYLIYSYKQDLALNNL